MYLYEKAKYFAVVFLFPSVFSVFFLLHSPISQHDFCAVALQLKTNKNAQEIRIIVTLSQQSPVVALDCTDRESSTLVYTGAVGLFSRLCANVLSGYAVLHSRDISEEG